MKLNDSSLRFQITQSSDWEIFQKAAGRDVYVMKLKSKEKALFVKFSLPLGKSWLLGLGVDFKRFCEEDFTKLINYARSINATHIRCEGFSSNKLINSYKTKPISKPFLPQHTIKIELNLSEKEILSQMKRKGRYNIKVAKKSGVKIEHYLGEEFQKVGEPATQALNEFYNILKETGGRDDFGIHPKKYYEKMLSSLGKSAHLYLALLSDDNIVNGKVIAGTIVIYGEMEAVYYYGASSNEHRNVMAPYLLQWTAITDAKKAGKLWYDFMGVARPKAEDIPRGDFQEFTGESLQWGNVKKLIFDTSDPLYGVTEFKQKFGGKLFIFEKPIDIVLNPLWYSTINTIKYFRNL